MTGRNAGTWVYAVTECGRDVPDLHGVGNAPLRAVTGAGLMAVVSPVDLAEYGEEPLRRNLEDLDWLGLTARAHHDVIDAISETGPVIPMQLATIYREEERVAAMLAERGDDFAAALDGVRGRIEWGVKIYLSDAGGAPQPAAAGPRPGNAARPGAAYLQRRRSQLSAREQAQQAAAASAEAIHADLAGLAAATRLHKPQHPQLTGRSEPMILNGAYLVDDKQAGAFSAAAGELAGQHPGVRIELTGPWPPYSFTLPDEPDAGTAEGGPGG